MGAALDHYLALGYEVTATADGWALVRRGVCEVLLVAEAPLTGSGEVESTAKARTATEPGTSTGSGPEWPITGRVPEDGRWRVADTTRRWASSPAR
ncbi:hypothetical protein Acsp05_58970 [Actinokineospora sp. NBRC 105648]|nr:hypothetical protein Acsp05_58970 [Actinokineospora sp. NBRC 105648]